MGWTKKNGIYQPHREPTCLCAFDADPGNYMRNASAVSQWTDLSGNGHHALQATISLQPTWIESDPDFGGRGSLSFDGTNDFLSAILSSPSAATWYVVGKPGTASTSQVFLDAMASSTRQSVYTRASAVVGSLSLYAGTAPIYGTTDIRSVSSVICVSFNGTSTVGYQNSSATPCVSGNPGSASMTDLCIGAYQGTYNFFGGKMAFLALYSGVNDSAMCSRIMNYLGNKYRIAIL